MTKKNMATMAGVTGILINLACEKGGREAEREGEGGREGGRDKNLNKISYPGEAYDTTHYVNSNCYIKRLHIISLHR